MTEEKIMTNDAFSNPLFNLGFGSTSPLEATMYPTTRMTENYALLNSLYRDNWVVQNVIEIVPEDMCREWFNFSEIAPEELDEIEHLERATGIKAAILKGLKWGRLYGGAAGLIMIDGQYAEMDKPLNINAIMPNAFKGVLLLDRWCGVTPDVETTIERGEVVPKYYNVTSPEGNIYTKVHHSRIIRFIGRDLPYLERMEAQYWGESEIEALYNEVVKHDNVSANMAALTFRANTDTMEVQNLDQLFSVTSRDMQQRFWNVLQAQATAKSNFGMQLINKGDKVQNNQYNFAGLPEVYNTMCLSLSGASHIPMTKLFGRSPSGLNSTGESDLINYYDYIASQRESRLRPILEQLLPVVCMSALGYVPKGIKVTFPPLWTPTAKEVAEIAKTKTETIIKAFQASLIDAGTAKQELKKLVKETGLFDSIEDEEIEANRGKSFMELNTLHDPIMGVGYGDN